MNEVEVVSDNIIQYAKDHGRFHLPWKLAPNPYRVWVSEIMLQQTQVQTVLSYYERFMQRFADVQTLANSPIDDVLKIWAGLGYYRRAHFIHQAAIMVCQKFNGVFPQTLHQLMQLPGVGRSTAGAILSQAMDISAPILDGNVKRVLCRYYQIEGYPDSSKVIKQLWAKSEAWTPKHQVALYTQGIMDLGATICTKTNPDCQACPIHHSCLANKHNSQEVYPHPKPKKTKPLKRCLFGVITNQENQLLLLKRPNRGIWGGMWCLPSIRCMSDFKLMTQDPISKFVDIESLGNKGKHAFSHFNLEYKPVKMSLKKRFAFKKRDVIWVSLEDALDIGLPAPIKKLVRGQMVWLK